ncbi:hypothetical protein [Leifsonia sp. P73]|uniref:hypothetical protein n=1 Tax=Leifsonia sp. P73 TaxID=3423959 RepID=UPI003DA43C13
MHDDGLIRPPHTLIWNRDAIAAAASRRGVRDLATHLGAPLPAAPTGEWMCMLVASLPIAFADTVTMILQ